MQKYNYTIHHMEDDLMELLPFLEAQDFAGVVGVARGGLVPAVYLSHALELPCLIVSYSSYEGNGSRANDNVLPEWLGTKKFLVVDDICDTGQTMSEIMAASPESLSLVLTHKVGSAHRPDFIGRVVPGDAWVDFAWEKLKENY